METDLGKVLEQKIPYHAYVYPQYNPIMEVVPDEDLIAFFKELKGMVIEDDDGNDDRSLASIKRAHIIAGTEEHEHEGYDPHVFSHGPLSHFLPTVEERIRRNGWSVKNFKIFHVWNLKVNGKSDGFPWSAKFQPVKKAIEIKIHSEKRNENDTDKVEVVDLIVGTDDCDKILTVVVDNCELNYSVFSDAWRLELEMRLYEDDGTPALNFKGDIRAYFIFGKDECAITLFHGERKNEESEVVIRSSLILPRRIWGFDIKMSLEGNSGKINKVTRLTMIPRSVPIDEQHYILGQQGYMLLTAKWGCCCVDKGLCVCPGRPACGIKTFQADYPSSEESSEENEENIDDNVDDSEDDDEDSIEDNEENIDDKRAKRTKLEGDPPVFGGTVI